MALTTTAQSEATAITTAARTDLIALAIAMFKAAPGAFYLNDFVVNYDAGMSLNAIATSLAASGAFKTVYPSLETNSEFATRLIDNLLGTEVAAADRTWAIDWVTGQMNGGTTRANVIVTAFQALLATTNTAFANAKTAFLNKIAVAEYYSVTKLLSDTDLADLQQVIVGVTSSAATVTAAKAIIDNITLPPFVLTEGVDLFVGGAGNDSFTATNETWTPLDNLNGGGGVDTLTINDVLGADVVLTKATTSSIEKLFLNSLTGLNGDAANITTANWTALTDANFNLLNAGAAQTITASTTLSTLTITNVAGQDLKVIGGSGVLTVTNGAAAVDVGTAATANSYTSASFKGGTTVSINDRSGAAAAIGSKLTTVSLDTLTGAATLQGKGITSVSIANGVAASDVTITNATAGHTQNLTLNKNATGVVITDATATTVNVATTGAASAVALAIAAATTLNTSGTVGLTLDTAGAVYTALATVNIANTGAVTADLSGAAALTAIVATTSTGANTVTVDATKATYAGGSGVDKVTVAVTATKAIDGGAGTDDVLVLNGAAGAAQVGTKATGFEVLGLGGAATGAYDATGFAKLTHGAVTAAVTYNNVSAAPTLTITASPGFGTTVNLKDVTGTSDSLALKITGAGVITAGTITAAGLESISINSDDTATTPLGGFSHTVTLVSSATSITVTGDAGLTLTNVSTDLTLVDASAVTKGSFSFTSDALTKAATINGGAGSDTLDASASTNVVTVNAGAGDDAITTSLGSDVINAGDGNDVINSGIGLDTVNVGAGNDRFILSANANGNVYATLTGMGAGDKIDFLAGSGIHTFNAAGIVLAPTAAFADFLEAASNGADIVRWFQYGGDTYVVQNDGASNSFENGVDQVVKLTGLVDLSTATIDAAVTNILTLG